MILTLFGEKAFGGFSTVTRVTKKISKIYLIAKTQQLAA